MSNVQEALKAALAAIDLYDYTGTQAESELYAKAESLCKAALAEINKCEPVAYHDVLNALVGMCDQYLTMHDGHLDHMFMSAGENALEVLEKLELITGEFGKIIPEALDENWIKNKFELKHLNTKG